MPAAFYLPETDLEVIIRSGGGQKDSRKRIYAKYTEGKSTDEIIAFLKKDIVRSAKVLNYTVIQYLYGLMKTDDCRLWYAGSGICSYNIKLGSN